MDEFKLVQECKLSIVEKEKVIDANLNLWKIGDGAE